MTPTSVAPPARSGERLANRRPRRIQRLRRAGPSPSRPGRIVMQPVVHAVQDAPSPPRQWYRHAYVQVLAAILIGGLIGYFNPQLGVALKPLGDAFVKLV